VQACARVKGMIRELPSPERDGKEGVADVKRTDIRI
jgi:hypothetical protein